MDRLFLMGPPSRPLLSVLFLSFISIESHYTLVADSSQTPPQRDPSHAAPPLSLTSQFSAPLPLLKLRGQTGAAHHHHSPPPRPSRTKSFGPGSQIPRQSQPKSASLQKSNLGKKIGLVFAAIAAALQVGVAGFLGFMVWRIARAKDQGADCSA